MRKLLLSLIALGLGLVSMSGFAVCICETQPGGTTYYSIPLPGYTAPSVNSKGTKKRMIGPKRGLGFNMNSDVVLFASNWQPRTLLASCCI